MNEDYGMLYIPELGLFAKIHRDKKGLYIHLPSHGKQKFRLKERKNENQ